ncbi:MAG: PAS domain-containing protein, partial [Colwellia sp.]|nr:PAS domain-containing protein [Colwellia sp.]
MFVDQVNLSIQTKLFFQSLVNESTQGVSVADLDGNYVFVNPSFCQMMGYSEAELLTMTVFDMKAPKQDHASFEQTKTVKENLIVQVLLQKKDGTIFMSEV